MHEPHTSRMRSPAAGCCYTAGVVEVAWSMLVRVSSYSAVSRAETAEPLRSRCGRFCTSHRCAQRTENHLLHPLK